MNVSHEFFRYLDALQKDKDNSPIPSNLETEIHQILLDFGKYNQDLFVAKYPILRVRYREIVGLREYINLQKKSEEQKNQTDIHGIPFE